MVELRRRWTDAIKVESRLLAAYERALREAQREEQIAQVLAIERQLVTWHLQDYEPVGPPAVPPPEPVDTRAVRKTLKAAAFDGVPLLDFRQRRQARSCLGEMLEAERARIEREREARHAEEERAAADVWSRWTANDPEIVLRALEAAFADNGTPAAPIDCSNEAVTIVLLFPGVELIPEQKPALSPTGKPTLRKRTKGDVNDLYAAHVASSVLATVREAFAVAPGANEVKALAVRRDPRGGSDGFLTAIYAGRCPVRAAGLGDARPAPRAPDRSGRANAAKRCGPGGGGVGSPRGAGARRGGGFDPSKPEWSGRLLASVRSARSTDREEDQRSFLDRTGKSYWLSKKT